MVAMEVTPGDGRERLIAAAEKFIARYDELWPKVTGVFQIARVHGFKWSPEDSWASELDALRAALAAPRGEPRAREQELEDIVRAYLTREPKNFAHIDIRARAALQAAAPSAETAADA